MPSKLDYLSKYASSSVADGKSEKRKRKKERKKRKTDYESKSRPRSLATNLVDEDDFPKVASDDDNDGDDEGPVVVPRNYTDLGATIQTTAPIGVWKSAATTSGSDNVSARRKDDGSLSGTIGRRCHKSSDEQDEKRGDLLRRRRYDSSSSEEEKSRQGNSKRRQRYDSSNEDEVSRQGGSKFRQRYDSPSKDESYLHRRKRRYDSDDSEPRERTTRQNEQQRQRYDSSDEEDVVNHDRKRRRYDSSSEDNQRQSRKSHDSFFKDEERSKHRGRRKQIRRQDSSSDFENGCTRQRRQRYDSEESDTDRDGRNRHDLDDDEADGSRKGTRMSSGHKAGLQNYKDFNKSERKIQAKRHRDAQDMVDKHGMGETVYRDKDGKKTKGETNGGEQVDATTASESLNQGRVQKEARDAKGRELLDLQNSGFARYRDDNRLEEELKNEIRKDDPMARYAISQEQKHRRVGGQKQQAPTKPVYKGPPPKVNRFGIRPGYRWDGNDRGNGFEDKILAKKFNRARKAEQSYKWSASDM